MTKARDLSQTPNASLGFKNRIINGDMRIDQRNAGASVTISTGGSAIYSLDRWCGVNNTDGTFTIQRSTVAPAGFTNSLLATVTATDSSIGATQAINIRQNIEGFNVADLGWGTANAQPITIGFWVRSSVTGQYGVAVNNSAYNRSYVSNFTINSANTYEYKTITIPGDTSGTWLTDNGIGLVLQISLSVGSDRLGTANTWASNFFYGTSGQVNWIGNAGATFYITGVQLEKGSTATSFDYRPYGTELALCQRYFFRMEGRWSAFSLQSSTGLNDRVRTYGAFPVPMRATPTATATQPIRVDLAGVLNRTQSSANFNGLAVSQNLVNWDAEPNNFSTLTYSATYVCDVPGGSVQFSAEL